MCWFSSFLTPSRDVIALIITHFHIPAMLRSLPYIEDKVSYGKSSQPRRSPAGTLSMFPSSS